MTYILGCLSTLSEVSHASYLSLRQVSRTRCGASTFITAWSGIYLRCLSTLSEVSRTSYLSWDLMGRTRCPDSGFLIALTTQDVCRLRVTSLTRGICLWVKWVALVALIRMSSLLRVTYILQCLSTLSEVSHARYLSLDQVGHTRCGDSAFITAWGDIYLRMFVDFE